jgi:hypothetical protein
LERAPSIGHGVESSCPLGLGRYHPGWLR